MLEEANTTAAALMDSGSALAVAQWEGSGFALYVYERLCEPDVSCAWEPALRCAAGYPLPLLHYAFAARLSWRCPCGSALLIPGLC